MLQSKGANEPEENVNHDDETDDCPKRTIQCCKRKRHIVNW